MLQREPTRPKRSNHFTSEEGDKEKFSNASKDSYDDRFAEETQSSLASNKLSGKRVRPVDIANAIRHPSYIYSNTVCFQKMLSKVSRQWSQVTIRTVIVLRLWS